MAGHVYGDCSSAEELRCEMRESAQIHTFLQPVCHTLTSAVVPGLASTMLVSWRVMRFMNVLRAHDQASQVRERQEAMNVPVLHQKMLRPSCGHCNMLLIAWHARLNRQKPLHDHRSLTKLLRSQRLPSTTRDKNCCTAASTSCQMSWHPDTAQCYYGFLHSCTSPVLRAVHQNVCTCTLHLRTPPHTLSSQAPTSCPRS